MKPLLTVAIPTYNGGENLKRAVLSCKHIKLPEEEFEILVIDNCSTDNSIEKIENLTLEMKNIRIIKNKVNVGRVGNWNRCLEEAKGKYLLFLFSNDEIYKDNNLEEIIYLMNKKHIKLSLSSFYIRRKNNSDFLFVSRINKKEEYFLKMVNSKEFCVKNLLKFSFPFAPMQSTVFDLEFIKLRGFKFYEEFELNTDQIFTYMIAYNSGELLINNHPIFIWDLSANRFHNNVTIGKVIKEDIRAYNFIVMKLELKGTVGDVHRHLDDILIRIFFNKTWNKKDKYDILYDLIKEYNIKFLPSMYRIFLRFMFRIVKLICKKTERHQLVY